MKKSNNEQEVYEIDLLRLVKVMWSHAILIIYSYKSITGNR